MRRLFIFALFLASTATGALAQTYKCTVGGKFVYSDSPCAGPGARVVDSGGGTVSQQAEIEALRRSLSQKQQLQEIERERAADHARVDARAAAVADEDRRQAAAKARRCASAQSAKADNDRRVARYQDWGWQHSQNQARAERETAERRVRDNCD